MKIPKSKPKYANPNHPMNSESTGPSTTIKDLPGKMPKRSPVRRVANQSTGKFASD
jgi:hypothetical protein